MSKTRLIIDMDAWRATKNHRGYGSPCHLCREKIEERFFLSKSGLCGKRSYYHIFCALKVHVIDQAYLLAYQLRGIRAACPQIMGRE